MVNTFIVCEVSLFLIVNVQVDNLIMAKFSPSNIKFAFGAICGNSQISLSPSILPFSSLPHSPSNTFSISVNYLWDFLMCSKQRAKKSGLTEYSKILNLHRYRSKTGKVKRQIRFKQQQNPKTKKKLMLGSLSYMLLSKLAEVLVSDS